MIKHTYCELSVTEFELFAAIEHGITEAQAHVASSKTNVCLDSSEVVKLSRLLLFPGCSTISRLYCSSISACRGGKRLARQVYRRHREEIAAAGSHKTEGAIGTNDAIHTALNMPLAVFEPWP